MNKSKIDKIFSRKIKSKQIHETILFIENTKGDFSYHREYGNKNLDSPLLMASVTKLFTTTCVLILLEQGVLTLEDKITKYFDNDILKGLHLYKEKEYSFDLTIADLLFQKSGLPEIFSEGKNNIKNDVISKDLNIGFEDSLDLVKKLKPHFAPKTSKKAHYADVNFDILGEILVKVTKCSLEDIYAKFIFNPLSLKKTYLPTNEDDFIPNIYYKDKSLSRPQVIISSRASGGCVTTARELMTFTKAFFNGVLFNKKIFERLASYSKLQFSKGPIYYGGGYMQIPLGKITTLFMGKGELLGHSGSTGSFAFYYPHKDLFIVGDVNQMANPAIPIRLIIQLALTIK